VHVAFCGQAVHDDAPAALYVPGWQVVHDLALAALNLPAGQFVHGVLPVVECVPAEHAPTGHPFNIEHVAVVDPTIHPEQLRSIPEHIKQQLRPSDVPPALLSSNPLLMPNNLDEQSRNPSFTLFLKNNMMITHIINRPNATKPRRAI
jgi:hypothetical protein